MATGKRRSTATAIQRTERQHQAVELRKAGLTFDAIGEHLGITRQSAHELVSRALAQYDTATPEAVEALRRLEAARLEEVHEVLWPEVKSGNLPVIERWLKVASRRAQLLGLDRSIHNPVEQHLHLHPAVQISQADADPVVIEGLRRWRELTSGDAGVVDGTARDVTDGEA
jgi:hypothetical protein